MGCYLNTWDNFISFRGRASRREFLYFMLINLVIVAAATVVQESLFNTFNAVFLAIVMFPSATLAVRRLHDIGFSGKWIFLSLVPIVNLVLFVLLSKKGQACNNIYASPPQD